MTFAGAVLDQDRLNTLFLATAKAIKNMPAMEDLEMRLVHYDDSLLEFDYRKQGDALVATWHGIEELRLSDEVLRELGVERNQLKVTSGRNGVSARMTLPKRPE